MLTIGYLWEEYEKFWFFIMCHDWLNVSAHSLLISNHTGFLVQFEINLHLWVFQKAESCTRRSSSCNLSFLKNLLRMITYTYIQFCPLI